MNEITLRPTGQITEADWRMIQLMAPTAKESRLFGLQNDAQGAVIMAKGQEIGLSRFAALEFIVVIDGKPGLSPRGALALVTASGLLESMSIEDVRDAGEPVSCRVSMKRLGGQAYTLDFTMADARRAGLVKQGSGWEKYPANMLRWRCMGYVIDVLFSDICGGLKRADEYGAELDTSGNVVVDGSWTPAPAPQIASPTAPATAPSPAVVTPIPTLAELLGKYPADAIIAANGGRIPGSEDELLNVQTALEGAS